MSVTRRAFLYVLTIITLVIFAVGAGMLLSLFFDITIKGSYLAQVGGTAFNREQLSLGLAMLIIGGPLWFLFWQAVRRRVAGNQEETGSAIRKLFLNYLLLQTALFWLATAEELFRWLLDGMILARFSSSGLAILIVAGIVWYYHWQVSETEGHPTPASKTLRRWYVYILAGWGLIRVAAGPVQLIYAVVSNLPIWGGTLVPGPLWNSTAQAGLVWTVLGGFTWYFHWFRMGRGDFESTLRQVYFYLLAILGGAIAALVALTITIYRVFVWATGGATSSLHFQFLGWSVPTILIGVAIWRYHQWLAQEEAAKVYERGLSAERVHFYLMSFLGLGTIVSGFIILFGILLDLVINAVSPPVILTPGWWRNQLSLCLALLIVGTPLWTSYWGRVVKRAETGGALEWRARSRRIFLYAVVAISIITLAADLVNLVYQPLNGILQAKFGINVLRSAKWSLQTVIVAAVVLWYHWQAVRTDQRHGAESATLYKNVTLLAGSSAADLIPRIEKALGFKIRILNLVEQASGIVPALSDEEVVKLAGEIQSAPSTEVMLVATLGKLAVLPYQKK